MGKSTDKDKYRERVMEMYLSQYKTISETSKTLGLAEHMVRQIMRESGKIRTRSERLSIRGNKISKSFAKGYFQSTKSGKWFPAASSYEFLRMKQLDEDPLIAEWDRSVPTVIYNGNKRYIPDFYTKYTDGSVVIEEVKPEAQVGWEINTSKWAAAERQLEKMGMQFRVITEKEIGIESIKSFSYEGFSAATTEDILERRRQYIAEYKSKNAERIKEWHKKARLENPEKYQEKDRTAVVKYAERRKAYRDAYYKENKEAIKEKVSAWSGTNRDHRKAYMKEYYSNNKHKWQAQP